MLLDLSGRNVSSLNDNTLVLQELSKRRLSFDDVTELDVSGCGLEDLFGIDLFRNLKTLNASNNNISLLDPLVSLNLKNLKLNHNKVEYLYVKELKNGKVVLSSDPDNEYTESFLNFGVNYGKNEFFKSADNQEDSFFGFDFVDLSFNKIKVFENMTLGRKFQVKVMNLSNNQVSNFSGLRVLSGVNSLDISFNEECDLEHLKLTEFSSDCEVFLQSTPLTNKSVLTTLLNTYQNMVVHHETDSVQHNRLVNPYDLHLNKVKHKKFVKSVGEYAGFVYEGETSPSELLTPRYLDTENSYSGADSKDKASNSFSQLETQSTIDDLYNEDNKLPSLSSIYNEMNEVYGPRNYKEDSKTKENKFNVKVGSRFVNDLNELDFLISSMELCKKIDMWSDDIKNTLYKDIID